MNRQAAVPAGTRYAELLEKNRRYLWNPFTQMQEYLREEPLIIERGEGVRLIDVNGRAYYDGNASVWLNVHGHNRKELNDAIQEQLGKIAHSTLLGMANVPAIELAERLVHITPEGLEKVFYSDSGAESVEIGLKMAFLYWKHRGRPEKNTFLSMKNAYHGDTVGAVSVGGIDVFHSAFDSLLFPTEKVTYPHPYRFPGTEAECAQHCLDELERKLQEKGDRIAGLIVEPLVQGAGGIITMPDGFLKETERLCRQYDVLLLTDEVATGFGRTGTMFACDREGVKPDILMAAKGITGGYLPIAVTLTTDEIYEAFLGDYAEVKTFFHGHSYTGNQLGCAVALANLDLFEQERLLDHIQESDGFLQTAFRPIEDLSHVGEVRRRGLMAGVELVKDKDKKTPYSYEELIGVRVCRRAKELGLITRPLGNVITFLPPLCATKEELSAMLTILHRAIREVTER
jgi:lysine---8-amino-7-oxononanoate aminotransferase